MHMFYSPQFRGDNAVGAVLLGHELELEELGNVVDEGEGHGEGEEELLGLELPEGMADRVVPLYGDT